MSESNTGFVVVYCENDVEDYNYFTDETKAYKNAADRVMENALEGFVEAFVSTYDYEDARKGVRDLLKLYAAGDYRGFMKNYQKVSRDIEYDVYVYVDDCYESNEDTTFVLEEDMEAQLDKIFEDVVEDEQEEDEDDE